MKKVMIVSAIMGFLDPAGPVDAPCGTQQDVFNVLGIHRYCPVEHWCNSFQVWPSSLEFSQ
jgi:hypothetical protein